MRVIIKLIILGLILACGAKTGLNRNEKDAKSISPDSYLKPDSNTKIEWKNLTKKCNTDADCVAVRICGCELHEPCGCAIPASEFKKNRDKCIVRAWESAPNPCPRECLIRNTSNRERCKLYFKYCCEWCTPVRAECYEGECIPLMREGICM